MLKWLRSLSFNFQLKLGRLVIVIKLKPATTAKKTERQATEEA